MTPLDEAKALIERMKEARGCCAGCEHVAYADIPGSWWVLTKAELAAQGWYQPADRAGFVRRCETCRSTPTFPWAGRLDAERVREYAEKQRHRFIWPLAELKALVEP